MTSEQNSDATLIACARALVSAGKPLRAGDLIVEQIDRLLTAGKFDRVVDILRLIDPDKFPSNVLTGVLSVTWHAKAELSEEHERFLHDVLEALETTWNFPEDRIRKIKERLS